jgi:excisionase family DNA binding protein
VPAPLPLLTIAQVAERLGCSPKTVRRIIVRGELRVVALTQDARGDRVREVDLEAFIASRLTIRGAVSYRPSVTPLRRPPLQSALRADQELMRRLEPKRKRRK